MILDRISLSAFFQTDSVSINNSWAQRLTFPHADRYPGKAFSAFADSGLVLGTKLTPAFVDSEWAFSKATIHVELLFKRLIAVFGAVTGQGEIVESMQPSLLDPPPSIAQSVLPSIRQTLVLGQGVLNRVFTDQNVFLSVMIFQSPQPITATAKIVKISDQEQTRRAMERNESGWFDGFYIALGSFVRLVEARIKVGNMKGSLVIANRLGPEGYMAGRMFTRIVTEQTRLGDHAGALASARRIPATGKGLVCIEALTIIALSLPKSDDVRHAIEEHQLTASPVDTIALTMAYAALRDWHRSIAFALTLEERWRREALHCILGMFGSPSNLNCVPQVDI